MNLTFESLLEYDRFRERKTYTPKILQAIGMRGIKPSDTISCLAQPFCNLEYQLFEATGDRALIYRHTEAGSLIVNLIATAVC